MMDRYWTRYYWHMFCHVISAITLICIALLGIFGILLYVVG